MVSEIQNASQTPEKLIIRKYKYLFVHVYIINCAHLWLQVCYSLFYAFFSQNITYCSRKQSTMLHFVSMFHICIVN